MRRGLMQEEELDNLGFHAEGMRKIRNETVEGRKEGATIARLCVRARAFVLLGD